MIEVKRSPKHQRQIEAGRAARKILASVEARLAPSRCGTIGIDPSSRARPASPGLRRLAAHAGRCSLGAAHDANCLVGFWSYMSTMTSGSLYKGIGVVGNWIDFTSRPAEGDEAFVTESGLEVLIDMHVLKRLALRLNAKNVDAQVAALRPVIAWCAAANQIEITGRFVVPTTDGLFFCTRDVLPASGDRETGEIGARIVTFYSFDEMRRTHKDSWSRMAQAGILSATPSYPRLKRAGKAELVHLCNMIGEDLLIRGGLDAAVGRPAR